jgi:phage shock protein PspC (stress-responsive transcriptional regulator)
MKNLHLSSTNSIIGGVCGGLGETLGIDPTIIRVLWTASFFLWGIGSILYLMCWIIFPEE